MRYTRNDEACTKCGTCAADCSPLRYGLISSTEGIANPSDPRCESCGHCYSVCPFGAITNTKEPPIPQLIAGFDGEGTVSPGGLFALLAIRRSERRFSDRPIKPEVTEALLTAAAQTPSGGNARTIECLVLPDDNRRDELLGSIGGFYRGLLRIAQNRITRAVAGAVLGKAAGAFLNDPEYRRRFIALVEAVDSGIDPVFYAAPLVLLFHSKAVMPTPEEDAVLAAYNVALAAVTLGLGSCFVSMAQKALAASRSVRQASGLERDERVLAVLAVGYPEAQRRRPVFRPALPPAQLEDAV